MKTEKELRARIMRHVYGIYIFRKVTSPAVRLGVIVAAFVIFVSSVSVSHVITNMLNVTSISGLMNFLLVAALNTKLEVQLALSVAFIFILWTIVDLVRQPQKMPLAA